MVTYYGSDRFAPEDAALPSLARRREVVTGRIRIACPGVVSLDEARLIDGEFSSLGIAQRIGFHRYESLLPIRSLEWRAHLRTLGGDKPVIPGVAFIR